MSITARHLNCGAMQPYGGGLMDGATPGFGPAEMSCHCLLLETEAGLVLIDTGVVSDEPDIDRQEIAAAIQVLDRPRLNGAESAASHIRNFGHAHTDVAHIVMTHLDFDHAAGLKDFPQARIHLSATEAEVARNRRTPKAAARYRPAQWAATQARWRTYGGFDADWFGLPATPVEGITGLMLVWLPGHTDGHCGVAIQTGDGWLLHAGDAIMNGRELGLGRGGPPTGARVFQWVMQTSQTRRRRSLARLKRLAHDHSNEVTIICTHDPALFPHVSSRPAA